MVLRNYPNFIGGQRYVASKDTFLKRKATALSALIWTGAFLVGMTRAHEPAFMCVHLCLQGEVRASS